VGELEGLGGELIGGAQIAATGLEECVEAAWSKVLGWRKSCRHEVMRSGAWIKTREALPWTR
jgi:hypothetical protein